MLLFLILLIVLSLPLPVSAQVTSTDIAQAVTLTKNVKPGTLVCFLEHGIGPCKFGYDSGLYGVVTDTPAGAISEVNVSENTFLVARTGVALVRITNEAGAVKSGDFITSSTSEGVAIRASDNGFVLGQALEDYNGSGEGLIQVTINIHQTTGFADSRSNLFELLRKGISAPVLTPLSVFRYLLAVVILLTSFVLGFVYFGRMARVSVEAIGRNPLASKTIRLTIFLNVFVMLIIFCIGLALAYLILAI